MDYDHAIEEAQGWQTTKARSASPTYFPEAYEDMDYDHAIGQAQDRQTNPDQDFNPFDVQNTTLPTGLEQLSYEEDAPRLPHDFPVLWSF
jgi:hypothetical protein